MIAFMQKSPEILINAFLEHVEITLMALALAVILSFLVTAVLVFYPKLREISVYLLSLLYAVPSFALFALLIPVTGLGKSTAVIVLVLYAQYSMVRTFLSGITGIDPAVREAAAGMGMNRRQLLFSIQIPLAKASIFAGIRLAASSVIAIATIASAINAGGLGTLLFDGLRTMHMAKILWGIFLTVAWSGMMNLLIWLLEELLRSRGDER